MIEPKQVKPKSVDLYEGLVTHTREGPVVGTYYEDPATATEDGQHRYGLVVSMSVSHVVGSRSGRVIP